MAFASNASENENVYTLVGAVSTAAGTAAQNLVSVTIPANTLRRNGQSLRIKAWGHMASNGNNKTVALAFGPSGSTTTFFTSGTTTLNNKDWVLEGTLTRVTSATQEGYGFMCDSTPAVTAVNRTAAASLTVDLTAANVLNVVCTDGTSSANDIIIGGCTVEGLSD